MGEILLFIPYSINTLSTNVSIHMCSYAYFFRKLKINILDILKLKITIYIIAHVQEESLEIFKRLFFFYF